LRLKKNLKRRKNQKLFNNKKKNRKVSKFNLQVNLKMIEKEDFSNKDRKLEEKNNNKEKTDGIRVKIKVAYESSKCAYNRSSIRWNS
jgi:hypothetical protein